MRNLPEMKRLSCCLIAVTVAACATMGENNAVATYRASGTEPFWSLTMTDARMVYDAAAGPDVTVVTPARQNTRAGTVYARPRMEVFVSTFRDCALANGQEGNIVRVTIGGQTVTGCGSGALPR